MRRWLIASGLVAVLAIVACEENRGLAPPPPPTDESRSPFFGVNGDVVFQSALQGRQALVDRQLAQIAAVPISYVRSGIDWRGTEPEPPEDGKHKHDFSKQDAWVEALARHGLRWAPNLLPIPIPAWAADLEKAYAGCGTRAPPKGTKPFVDFVSAIAKRYGRGGSFWMERPNLPRRPVTSYEIWNAPNHPGSWCPRPHPPAFAKFAVAASTAIRALDPHAEIVLGGLAPYVRDEPRDRPVHMALDTFVKAAVAAEPELPDALNAVAIHLYGNDPAQLIESAHGFRRSLDEAGFSGAPMILNELGWPRAGMGGFRVIPDEETRADTLRTLIEALHDARHTLDIESVAPYSWITAQQDPRNQDHWFGLADPRTTEPYASGNAYREVVEQLSSGE